MPFDLLQAPPRVAYANFYPFERGEQVGPQWSESSLFLVATKGVGEVRVGGESFAMTPETAVHVPWATPVHYLADRQRPFVLIGVHLVFGPWSAAGLPKPLHAHASKDSSLRQAQPSPCPQPYPRPLMLAIPAQSTLVEVATAMASTFDDSDDPQREARLRMQATAFLLEFGDIERRQWLIRKHPKAETIGKVLRWLDEHFREGVSRAEIARRCGLSGSTLNAAFHAVTGRSPIDYVIELRLAEARRLLRSSGISVADIAKQVGIADLAYFSKLFRKRHGISPLKFRQNRRI